MYYAVVCLCAFVHVCASVFLCVVCVCVLFCVCMHFVYVCICESGRVRRRACMHTPDRVADLN
jgi:hypothetical protein